jgi:uncharacterized protein YcfJ
VEDGDIVSVQPELPEAPDEQEVPEVIQVCNTNQRESRGLIEGASKMVFGSTGGVIGTVIGYGIGSQIGGGSGTEIAKVAGAIVGNSVGNSVQHSAKTQCHYREVLVRRDVVRSLHDGYNVYVQLHGNQYVVHRGYAPEIGSTITVLPRGYD